MGADFALGSGTLCNELTRHFHEDDPQLSLHFVRIPVAFAYMADFEVCFFIPGAQSVHVTV
jgi:hypothetical protein